MKVIFNVDAITHPITGIGHYALQLGKQLKQHKEVEVCRFFSASRWIKEIEQVADANQSLSLLRKYLPLKSLALKVYSNRRSKAFKQLTSSFNDHIFHSPNFLLMPFEGKSVSTIHDLSFIHYPQNHPKYRIKFLEEQLPKSLKQADALITDSQFVKQELVDILSVDDNKIHVTPLGVDPCFTTYSEQQTRPTLNKHALHGKSFILSVATTEPRKNLLRLLEAYVMLDSKMQKQYPLLLVGSAGWLNQKLSKKIEKLVKQNTIINLGYVDFKELCHLYSAAHACVFPSLYEGFGLPILESMASGTPVLTSNTSSMPEVAAGNALLANPKDVEDISQQMVKLLSDNIWRNTSIPAGIAHSKKQSWLNCCEKTIKVYQSL